MPNLRRDHLVLIGFIVAKFLIHYQLISPVYDLHRDEYLHLDQGRHLAWGYLSVPPVTSWFSWLIIQLGNSVFWVKFFPALFGAAILLVVWKTVEALNGGLFAKSLAAVAVLFSVLMRLNILFQPNSLDVLCWTILLYFIIRFIQTNQTNWLYGAAVAVAFGFLNKYNIAFLVLGLLPALIVFKQWQILGSKHLYLAALLAIVLISPNLIWQYQNGFPVIHHMQLLAKYQLTYVSRIDFLKEQLLYFFSGIFLLIAAFISFFRYTPHRPYSFLFWMLVFTLAIYTYMKAKAYYAIGLYPIFLPFGAVYLEQLLENGKTRYLRPALLCLPILLFIPLLNLVFPIKSPDVIQQNLAPMKAMGLLRWEDGKDHTLPQDFADMLGWRELAQKVDLAMAQLDPETTLVLCDNYGQAGAINFYSKQPNMQAVTMNADYIDWFPWERDWQHVILVSESLYDDDPDRSAERPLFDTVYQAGKIENEFAREFGSTIHVLQNSKIDLKARIQQEIEEERWGN